MRPTASNKLVLGALALLTVGSVGLKSAVGAPADAPAASAPGQYELRLARTLQSQGFATIAHTYPDRSPAVLAVRGSCRISVRDAGEGSSAMAIFAADAVAIGPVRYLYQGKITSAAPALAMRIGRFTAEVRTRLGLESSVPISLALATSPGCGTGTFGL